MSTPKAILAATDFSDASIAALTQAARLASATGATLHVLHVASSAASDELAAFFPDTKDFGLEEATDALTERIASRLAAVSAPKETQIHVRTGNPFKAIVAAIDEFSADLLMLGTTGVAGHRLGTVGGKCVRKAKINVLLVPAGFQGKFAHITACVDFSSLSKSVINNAAAIAKVDHAALTAIYAHEKVDQSIFNKGPSQDLIDKLPSVIEARFDKELRGHAADQPVTFAMVTCMSYSDGIVKHATESKTDLVVTGTTGRSGLAYMLLGTTAEKVIRDVGCAVLAVKPAHD